MRSNSATLELFEIGFDEATELTGHMKLALYTSTDAGDDAACHSELSYGNA